jgi:hypothetical protein
LPGEEPTSRVPREVPLLLLLLTPVVVAWLLPALEMEM